MVSSVHTFKNNSQYKMCINYDKEDKPEQNCTKRLLGISFSYATINGSSGCPLYHYNDAECKLGTFGDEVRNITHKS